MELAMNAKQPNKEQMIKTLGETIYSIIWGWERGHSSLDAVFGFWNS